MKKYITCKREFHDLVESLNSLYPIYRGVSDQKYNLETSLGRKINETRKFMKDGDVDVCVNNEDEESALIEFKQRSIPHLKYIPENDWEWLALCQHYSLPTRLLDWTKKPSCCSIFCNTRYGEEEGRY